MMELESDFLTATNEKKVVMILDQACRNLMFANPLRSYIWQHRFDHQNSIMN